MLFDALLLLFGQATEAVGGEHRTQVDATALRATRKVPVHAYSVSRPEAGLFPPSPIRAAKCSRAFLSRSATADFRRPTIGQISARVRPSRSWRTRRSLSKVGSRSRAC